MKAARIKVEPQMPPVWWWSALCPPHWVLNRATGLLNWMSKRGVETQEERGKTEQGKKGPEGQKGKKGKVGKNGPVERTEI